MRAAVVRNPGQVAVAEVPDPRPGPGEILVRTTVASVCGSDLGGVFGGRGHYPLPPGAPGHELVGTVEQSDHPGFAPGDAVLCVPLPATAAGFAELMVADADHLVPLPPGADPGRLVLAQQLGTVLYAARYFWPEPPAAVAVVLGAGPAGLQFAQIAARSGFEHVVVTDPSEARRDLALKLGAGHALPAGAPELRTLVAELTGGVGADLVVLATGDHGARDDAAAVVRNRGRVGMYGLPEGPDDGYFPLGPMFRKQVTFLSAGGAQSEPGLVSFRDAVAAIADGSAPSVELVSHRVPLDDIGHALELARTRVDGAVKIVVDVAT